MFTYFFSHKDAIGTDGRPVKIVNLIAMIFILRMLLFFFWPAFDHIQSALSCGTSFYFWIIDFFPIVIDDAENVVYSINFFKQFFYTLLLYNI